MDICRTQAFQDWGQKTLPAAICDEFDAQLDTHVENVLGVIFPKPAGKAEAAGVDPAGPAL